MLKIFSRLIDVLLADAEPASGPTWIRDPLTHPDIAAMDLRALADLPFGRQRFREAPDTSCPA